MIRIFSDSIPFFKKEYGYPNFVGKEDICKEYVSAKELVSSLEKGDVALFESASDLGDNEFSIIASIRHIYGVGAYLLVALNPNMSCAVMEKSSYALGVSIDNDEEVVSFKDNETYNYKIKLLEDRLAVIKPFVSATLSYIQDKKEKKLPSNFEEAYWRYQTGASTMAEVCKSIDGTDFYGMCRTYENTVDYFVELKKRAPFILLISKKGFKDYEQLLSLLQSASDVGLVNGILKSIQKTYNVGRIDMWRLLRSFYDSRFYYNYLKKNPEFAETKIGKHLDTAMKEMQNNPNYFMQPETDVARFFK